MKDSNELNTMYRVVQKYVRYRTAYYLLYAQAYGKNSNVNITEIRKWHLCIGKKVSIKIIGKQ